MSPARESRKIVVWSPVVVAAVLLSAGWLPLTPQPLAAQRPAVPGGTPSAPAYPDRLAMTPPMGWNSYDAYWGDVNEQEMRANAEYMAKNLARYGWKYVVVDYYWYFPHPKGRVSEETLEVEMDDNGRLMPPANRFPSAAGGRGFKPLADYVHSLGLKFGIHIMRGIPREAVKRNLPILGTKAHARDVADTSNICSWSSAMYGVDVSKATGQAYYDSIAKLYAAWGVDFIKADDMSWAENPKGETYHGLEIVALRKAMNRSGRPMVLSLSPGPTALAHAEHVARWSQMWRVSGDMWDTWPQLKQQFDYARDWAQFSGRNHWPDTDMLPLGHVRIRGYDPKDPPHTRLTQDEQITLMTVWCIFRSPLMMGGDLPIIDPFTLSLLTNEEVLAVDQASTGGHELLRPGGDRLIWEANAPSGKAKYVAFVNIADHAQEVAVSWSELGVEGKQTVRDLWQKKDLGNYEERFGAQINSHGAGLYKVTPAR